MTYKETEIFQGPYLVRMSSVDLSVPQLPLPELPARCIKVISMSGKVSKSATGIEGFYSPATFSPNNSNMLQVSLV